MSVIQAKNQTKTIGFAEVFNRFFTALQAIFPAWRNAFPSTEHLEAAKRQWLEALVENGIDSSEKLSIGLKKARAEGGDFFPSPAKFVAWCKPSAQDLGLPSPESAYREAIDNAGRISDRHWSHKVIYHAATQVGLFDLARMTTDDARKAFQSAYEATCKAFLHGNELPEIPKAIAQPKPSKSDPETARRHLDAMRAMLGKKSPTVKPEAAMNRNDPMLENEGEAA